jgi:hypothetical protein
MAQLAEESSDGLILAFPTGGEAPASGIIFNGLMASPAIGGTDMLITAGVMLMIDPDLSPSTDDSVAKFIVDPGVSSSGVLVFTPNASGQTRVDIIECARVRSDRDGLGNVNVAATIIETSNRDIYNPSTGTFSAATVTKVRADGRLTFRIRTGTPGSGFPGVAAGWKPLAVAVVPTGTTNWDGATLYDVRNLVADRARNSQHQQRDILERFPAGIRMASSTAVGAAPAYVAGQPVPRNYLMGRAEVYFKGKRAGGTLPVGGIDCFTSPSTNVYAESGFATAVSGSSGLWAYLYAAFPYGLPRWCKYTGVNGINPRVPGNFRGIPIVSTRTPNDYTMRPSSALAFPPGVGLTGTVATTDAVCVFQVPADATDNFLPCAADGAWVQLSGGASPLPMQLTRNPGTNVSYNTGYVPVFDLIEGTNIPFGTRAVRIEMQATLTLNATLNRDQLVRGQIDGYEVAASTPYEATFVQGYETVILHINGVSTDTYAMGGTFTFSLPPNEAIAGSWAARTYKVGLFTTPGTNVTMSGSNGTAFVRAYKL